MDPAPFLRGNPFPSTRSVPYPRAKPGDGRIPGDTWYMATYPAGVRLEVTGDAEAVDITYECKDPQAVWHAPGARAFEAWRGADVLDIVQVEPGTGTARLRTGGDAVIYLPERLAPRIDGIDPVNGTIEPALRGPRWICYGDSIAEGWNASSPALSWPSIIAREHGLDLVNMSYGGAARGELAIAEQIAALPADVIAVTHGTNCWERVPHSEGLMREAMLAFLTILRAGHPAVPIVVCTAPFRPLADDVPNALGATLEDLRRAQRDAAKQFDGVTVVEGNDAFGPEGLADDVHPNDAGHRALADTFGPAIAGAVHG